MLKTGWIVDLASFPGFTLVLRLWSAYEGKAWERAKSEYEGKAWDRGYCRPCALQSHSDSWNGTLEQKSWNENMGTRNARMETLRY